MWKRIMARWSRPSRAHGPSSPDDSHTDHRPVQPRASTCDTAPAPAGPVLAAGALNCPYCDHAFVTTPARSRACPECKRAIVRRASKGVVRLLTEEAAAVETKATDAARAKRDAAERREMLAMFRDSAKRDLASFRESGIVKYVNTMPASDACEPCKELSGRQFALAEADGVLPHKGCTGSRGWCRCVWDAKIE